MQNVILTCLGEIIEGYAFAAFTYKVSHIYVYNASYSTDAVFSKNTSIVIQLNSV